jgi:threonine dehydratase
MELIEQNPYLDAVVVPIGGGGLIAGMSLVLKHVNPRIQLFGVEAAAMPGMLRSVQAGAVTPVPKLATMADGIAVERIGEVPLSVVRQLVDDIVTVDEGQIAGAVLRLLEVEKTVLEGSGAASLAAVLAGKIPLPNGPASNIAIICSGGNIDMTVVGRIIEKGLVEDGRITRIRVTIDDAPGSLARVTAVIAKKRANVRDIEHERAFLLDNVGTTQPVLTLETRGMSYAQRCCGASDSWAAVPVRCALCAVLCCQVRSTSPRSLQRSMRRDSHGLSWRLLIAGTRP